MKRNLLLITLLIAVVFTLCTSVFAGSVTTYYVSSSGNASNNGLAESTPTTLASAYTKSGTDKKIVLLDGVTMTLPSSAYSGTIEICGKSASTVLTLPATVTLNGAMTFDNVTLTGATIYAAGHPFTVGTGVTTSANLTVYGGANGATVASTNISLLGGKYANVYGGGNNGNVTGNTNVVFGGNANIGMGIDDSNSSTLCPTNVYGGGTGSGKVLGSTNITLKDNAVAQYVVGAGTNTAGDSVKDTNICIQGGKALGIYGGGIDGVTLTGCDTHITMTGGLVEQIFGGSQRNLTGNTFIYLLGGDVARRVYSGCYNDAKLSYSTSYYVNGTTNIVIGSGAKLASETGLSSGNKNNRGVYSGSRLGSKNSNEKNTLVFLDGCYDSQKSVIAKDSSYLFFLKFSSFEDYTIKASSGGVVDPTKTAGTVYVKPDNCNYGQIGSAYYINENAAVSTGATTVSFAKNFEVTSVSASVSGGATTGTVKYIAKNVKNKPSPKLYVGFYGDNDRLIGSKIYSASATETECPFECGVNAVKVKAMLIDGNFTPLAAACG